MRRLLKNILNCIYLHCGYVQVRDAVLSLLGRSRVVVVYYHRIGEADVLTKPVEEFWRELEYFKNHYECISLSELCRRLREGVPMRRRAVVITFDDGYRDNFTLGVPALKAARVPATFFVSTGFVGTERVFAHDRREAERRGVELKRRENVTWDDLRAMEAEGFEVGSHTVNHVNLGQSDEDMVVRELAESLAKLNGELGERPRAFSFPWGKPGDMSERAVEAAKEAGYCAAASAYGGSNTRGTDCFHILRVDVGNGELGRLGVRARVAGLDFDRRRLQPGREKPCPSITRNPQRSSAAT